MHNISLHLTLLAICICLCAKAQTNADSIFLVYNLDEVVVVQKQSPNVVKFQENKQIVSMKQLEIVPKFLGTSDPIRYIQTLPGIQTNSETHSGIFVQGCDSYQTLVSINQAPIFYPNHLLGLFSTFIPAHFDKLVIEQAEHSGEMTNRIGGMVDLTTNTQLPKRFSLTGNVGLVNSDLTLSIPCGKKSALWLSGRTTYLNLLYGKFMKIDSAQLKYNFQDYNLTYVFSPSEKDELVVSAFYSRDRIAVDEDVQLAFDMDIKWQNLVGSAYWKHLFDKGEFMSSVSFSAFDNHIKVHTSMGDGQFKTLAQFASAEWKNSLKYVLNEKMSLAAGANYKHYFETPLNFENSGFNVHVDVTNRAGNADEAAVFATFRHVVSPFFDYNLGVHATLFHNSGFFAAAADPRFNFAFRPAKNHAISLHFGRYHQYFHRAGLISGGLPTDFFLLADRNFLPEEAHAANLRYSFDVKKKWAFTIEGYFKQIFNTYESTSNPFSLVASGFDYLNNVVHADGRNYGLNVMLQKTSGYVTGHISYNLGWAKRKIPTLDGSDGYDYAASHERRHDLNVMISSRFAKRWSVSALFVLASGLPFTGVEELYMLNRQMICRYTKFNSSNLQPYHRLDLSCSYDIIQKNDHSLGVNLSIYNVYCHKNMQFVVYRQSLGANYGSVISTIIPSISIYGTF